MRSIDELIQGLNDRDWRALAKAITIVENDQTGKDELLSFAYEHGKEPHLLLGITGAGGSGKSTIINGLLGIYTQRDLRVGILAVDPSSAFSGGAVLGDRIRIKPTLAGANIFFRSFASRGALGGLSQGVKDVLYLYKAFGFDIIIVESYGVGQAETDITNFVDVTTVVLAPGNGDYMQHAKAGTQEIADIFVVNKADHVEAEALFTQLVALLDLLPVDHRPIVLKAVASEGIGISELAAKMEELAISARYTRDAKRYLRIENEIYSAVIKQLTPRLRKECLRLADRVVEKELTPFLASKILAGQIKLEKSTEY